MLHTNRETAWTKRPSGRRERARVHLTPGLIFPTPSLSFQEVEVAFEPLGIGFRWWMVVVFWVLVVLRVEPDVDVGNAGDDSDP